MDQTERAQHECRMKRSYQIPSFLLEPRPPPRSPSTKLELPDDTPDYYQVLSISQNASTQEIKAAYHRALLQHHPDKRTSPVATLDASTPTAILEISVIKAAYKTLISSESRTTYDDALRRRAHGGQTAGPRPAQVISLEDWTSVSPAGNSEREDGDPGPWRYPCRCSGYYEISEAMMENGVHLIGCSSCSEVVWAGYELQDDS
ncbi:hypothetical protein NMY22_g17787 [Coprinellus aureogranulatus]|nr:hypothetical protein NMY22_g17787 [Coprinellus aureogranulatus]